jgi:hypothetical protein
MFLAASAQRSAFGRGVLDFTGGNDVGLVDPRAIAAGFIAIHLAIKGLAAKRMPSGADDEILGRAALAAGTVRRCPLGLCCWLKRHSSL